MKEFHSVKSIFNDLKPFEIKELRKRTIGASSQNENSKVSILYIDILANMSDLTSEKAQYKLYNKLNGVAFRKLNQRFLNKILDILTSKDIIELNDQYDERAKELFILEKKLMLVDLLRFRGLFRVSDELLNQIINTLKQFENYELLIFALQKKRLRLPGTDSIEEKEEIDKEIYKFQKYSLNLSYIKRIYTDLILMHNNFEISKILSAYRIGIKKVDTISKKLESQSVSFYQAMVNAQYASLKGDDEGASEILIGLVESIKNSLVFTKNRLGTILLNIALYKRNTFNFSEAQLYLNESAKFLSRIDETKIILYYQNAVFHYVMGETDKSHYFIKLMTTIVTDKMELRIKNRIYFFFILNLFVQNKTKEAYIHIDKFKVKSKLDVNLEIERKILLLMILIDLELYDKADKLLDILRKQSIYTFPIKILPFSYNNFIKLFNALKKVGYDFNILGRKEILLFNGISEEFKIKGDLLIPFTPWFNSKLKNVPYDHSAAMREMRRNYKAEKMETV